MTARLIKAAGTLAVALIVLAGCDSAAPDASTAVPTADAGPPGGTPTYYTLIGPTRHRVGAVCAYNVSSIAEGFVEGWNVNSYKFEIVEINTSGNRILLRAKNSIGGTTVTALAPDYGYNEAKNVTVFNNFPSDPDCAYF